MRALRGAQLVAAALVLLRAPVATAQTGSVPVPTADQIAAQVAFINHYFATGMGTATPHRHCTAR